MMRAGHAWYCEQAGMRILQLCIRLLGCPPPLSPTARELPDPTQSPAGDRADILCVLQDRLLLSDVSVTHCCADTYVGQAAANAGSAAEARAANKVAKYALREPGGYDFTPLVVESCGRLCSATHKLLNLLGRQASDNGRVTKGAWVEGALRRLSVALCKRHDFLFRANLHAICRTAGKHPTRGATVPHTIEV